MSSFGPNAQRPNEARVARNSRKRHPRGSILIDLIFLSGSSQIGSVHWRLAAAVADLAAREFESAATTTVIYLKDLDLPNFSDSEDAANNRPADAVALKTRLSQADGIFMSSDEYTGAYSALLKNAIRWLSAIDAEGENPFRGIPVALCGASSRGAGSLRGQPALAQRLSELGACVIPQYLEMGTAPGLFDERGRLCERFERQLIDGCLSRLIEAGERRAGKHTS